MNENENPQTNDSADLSPLTAEVPAGTATATADPPAPAPDDALLPGKKKLTPRLIALLVAVVLGASVAVAAATGVFTPDPKTVVDDAFTATAEANEKTLAALKKEIPMLEPLLDTKVAAATDHFDLNFQSIEGSEGANVISALFADSGLKGTLAFDPAASVMQLDAGVYLAGKDLVAGTLFLSPELLAGSVPTFSDTILSLAPRTLVEDYKASPYYDPSYQAEESLALMQQAVGGYAEYMKALGSLSNRELLADIGGIFQGALANAVYEKGEKSAEGFATYSVTIPGADAKNAVIAYYRYIYFDSEFGTAMKNMMEPLLAADDGTSYEDTMNEVISTLETSCPELPCVLTLSINKQKVIQTLSLVAAPVLPADSTFAINDLALNYAKTATGETVALILDLTDNGTPLSLKMDLSDRAENGVYTMDLQMDVASSDLMTMQMPLTMRVDKDGNLGFSFLVDVLSSGEKTGIALVANGTMTREGDTLKADLPGVTFTVNSPYSDPVVVTLHLSGDTTPLTGPIPAPENPVPVLQMTEQEMSVLIAQYQDGAAALAQSLFAMMFGA